MSPLPYGVCLLCRTSAHIVTSGPYKPAILRFQASLPDQYPELPPLITFSTDIFHPLVVPLTTYTFSTGAVDANNPVSASDQERLPSGAFSLRNGFPYWFGSSRRPRESEDGSRRMSGSSRISHEDPARLSSAGTHVPGSDQVISILKALAYIKSSFEDPAILDKLPLEAAANPGAWHAWRSYRGLPKAVSRAATPAKEDAVNSCITQKQPGDWNWEGVFEKRANSGIEASTSEATLFGAPRGGGQSNDMVGVEVPEITAKNTN